MSNASTPAEIEVTFDLRTDSGGGCFEKYLTVTAADPAPTWPCAA